MVVPCKDCIALAVCRHKRYQSMITSCQYVHNLLYHGEGMIVQDRTKDFEVIIVLLEEVLNPSRWEYCHSYHCIDEHKTEERWYW